MGRSRDHYLPKLHGFLVAHFNSIPASILYFERACRYCQKYQTEQNKSLLTFTYLHFDNLVNTQKKKVLADLTMYVVVWLGRAVGSQSDIGQAKSSKTKKRKKIQ